MGCILLIPRQKGVRVVGGRRKEIELDLGLALEIDCHRNRLARTSPESKRRRDTCS